MNSWIWTRNSKIWTCTFEFQLVLLSFQLVTFIWPLVTRNSCFTILPYSRKHMPNWDFNKVAKQLYSIEITLHHECSPANLLHTFRTPFPKNTSGGCFWKDNFLFWDYPVISDNFSTQATNKNYSKITLVECCLINRDHIPLNKNKQSLSLELFDD